MMKKAIGISLVLVLVFGVAVFADDKTAEPKKEQSTFEGKLVCMSCDLKKAEGAHAACSIYGHNHALKTKDGKYISLLANDYSKDLLSGEKYKDKDVKVSGMYFANANTLDVKTFTIDGKEKSWCDHCKAMDGCQAKPKHKGM